MYSARNLTLVYGAMRKLAKSNKYQTLYNQYKETGIRIFENQANLNDYQITFIQYLAFYNNLYTDVYMDEVSDIVFEDEIYEDSYIYYKQKSKKNKQETPKTSTAPRLQQATTNSTHVVFSRNKARR